MRWLKSWHLVDNVAEYLVCRPVQSWSRHVYLLDPQFMPGQSVKKLPENGEYVALELKLPATMEDCDGIVQTA